MSPGPKRSTVSPTDDESGYDPDRFDDEDGYVHDPDRFDDDGEPARPADRESEGPVNSAGASEEPVNSAGASEEPVHPAEADREFDWRGWTLLAVVFVAFVVSPLAIYLYPPGAYGYLFALIVFPLLPAIVLAITAVWATARP